MTEEGLANWTGPCTLGKANGEGVATYTDSYIQTITGEMVYGIPTGIVRIDYGRGSYFVGTRRKGEAHGFGVNMESWGEGYEGNWADGFRHGEGIYIHSDGRRTPGVWRKGTGLVSSWYVDAKTGCEINLAPMNEPVGEASWTGDCIKGKAEGSGTISWSVSENGAPTRSTITFTGDLAEGVISGKGLWLEVDVFSNVTQTTTIEAVWKNGEINGDGREVRVSNFTEKDPFDKIVRSYEGGFKAGEFSGDGKLKEIKNYSNNGIHTVVKEGSFSDNFFDGIGKEIRETTSPTGGNSYEELKGLFEKNNFAGHGRMLEKTIDGKTTIARFDGDVNDGGMGTVSYANGDKFSGVIEYHSGPKTGYRDFPSVEFKGDCRRNSIDFSQDYGSSCLVAAGRTNDCLIQISNWIND